MYPQVLLEMVFVFEGLATFSAFELAVSRPLVKHLVLWRRKYSHEYYLHKHTLTHNRQDFS